jgi:GNAT superfamily N-acetyltransferase
VKRPDLEASEPEIAVRPAASADAAALAPLLGALGHPASADEVAARLSRLTAYTGPAVALVAVRGEHDVVGLVTAHAFLSLHAAAPAVWLTTLVVAPAARERGVGRRLVRAAEAWAAAEGAVRVSVTSGAHRAEAHRFYEGLGYAVTGSRFTRTLGADAGNAGAPGSGAA